MDSERPVTLSRIIEVKRTLTGVEKRFSCVVLRRDASHLIVRFIAPEAMNVHGVVLPAGTVTFGHFWSDRPYNVYHWLEQGSGATIGHYVNLSAETHLSDERLEWLDLVVDILILPQAKPVILDEDEIPADASDALRIRIRDAQAVVLRDCATLLAELERDRSTLWPSLSLSWDADREP